MKLTLLRHGITEGNARRLYYGSADMPLLPEGIADLEARRAAGGYPEAEAFYTSGLLRTEQTFAILYGGRPHGVLPELREMVSLLRRSSNNLNQLARRANETGRIYLEDLADIRQNQAQLWESAKEILRVLSTLD